MQNLCIVKHLNFYQDKGYPLLLHGEQVSFHGAIVAMCGDIPASNFIGGFKEGVGFSLRKCRMCMATADDISEKVMHCTVWLILYVFFD